MTGRRRHAVLAVAAWLVGGGSPLAGQATATLGLGMSVVEFDGFLTSGAAVLSPTFRFEAPGLSLGGQGSWTVFESGNQVFQGTAAAAWRSPARSWWRVELSGSAGVSKYAEDPGSSHVLAGARLHVFRGRSGAWIGAGAGGSFGGSTVTPVELGLGVWTVRGRLALVGTFTSSWVDIDHQVDVTAAARWTGGGAEVEVRAGARPWGRSPESGPTASGLFGELSALVHLTRRLALALGAGSYPSDPARRTLAARYATAGLRVSVGGSRGSPVQRLGGPVFREEAEPVAGTSLARLDIARSGDPRAVRVHVPGAGSVELRGDFTDWETVALAPAGDGVWEIRLSIEPGSYRVNVRVDGGPWLVPAGTRAEPTEFGGSAGVIVIS